MITHRRHRETWQQHEDRYRRQQEDRRREEERRRQEWNRHKDHWNYPFSSTVGSKTSSYPLLETALNAMAMIDMTDQIGSIRTMIAVLMGRLGEEPQFMIGWGAGSMCMTGLVTVSGIFL